MNDENSLDYYRRREATHRKRAAEARDPSIAKMHSELAERYACVVESQQAVERRRASPVTRASLRDGDPTKTGK